MNSPDSDRPPETGAHADPHQHHADVSAAPEVAPASTRRMVLIGIGVLVLLVVLFVVATLPRRAVTRELAAEVAGENVPPVVQVAAVHRATSGGSVELPGTIQALHEGALYARVTGYVKKWYFDIGSAVHAGDVLADIDAPELMRNVEQARHELAQVKASLSLAQADLARWKEMAADSAVSREELDQKQAANDVAQANVGAADANLQRLIEMEGYTRVKAPFAGVVTARNVDIGSLITAQGATSAIVAGGDVAGAQGAGSMFRIAETDTVRIFLPGPEKCYAPPRWMSDCRRTSRCRSFRDGPLPDISPVRRTRSMRPRARCSPRSMSSTRSLSCCRACTRRCGCNFRPVPRR